MIKRAVDVFGASVGLLLGAPVFLLVAIAIKLGSPGPVFYRAPRVGKNGIPFTMFKFRSMVTNADSIGSASTPDDDVRITPIGRIIRKFKLDELPQLINVLRGEMSLVGPRPNVQFDVDKYSVEERRILSVKPGITDFSSIRYRNEGEILKGCDDPDRAYDELIRPGKIFLQLRYVNEQSLLVDLKLIWWTAAAVLCKPFGYTPPHFSIPTDFNTAMQEKKIAVGESL